MLPPLLLLQQHQSSSDPQLNAHSQEEEDEAEQHEYPSVIVLDESRNEMLPPRPAAWPSTVRPGILRYTAPQTEASSSPTSSSCTRKKQKKRVHFRVELAPTESTVSSSSSTSMASDLAQESTPANHQQQEQEQPLQAAAAAAAAAADDSDDIFQYRSLLWYSGHEIRRMKQACVPVINRVDANQVHHIRGIVLEQAAPQPQHLQSNTSNDSQQHNYVSIRGLEFGTKQGQVRRKATQAFQSKLLQAQHDFWKGMEQNQETPEQDTTTVSTATTTEEEPVAPPEQEQEQPLATEIDAPREESAITMTQDCLFLKFLPESPPPNCRRRALQLQDEEEDEEQPQDEITPSEEADLLAATLAKLSLEHSQEAVQRAQQIAIEDAAFVCQWMENVPSSSAMCGSSTTSSASSWDSLSSSSSPYYSPLSSKPQRKTAQRLLLLQRVWARWQEKRDERRYLKHQQKWNREFLLLNSNHNNNNNNKTMGSDDAVGGGGAASQDAISTQKQSLAAAAVASHELRPRVDTESTATLILP